jgi:hypothetical protein
MDGRPIGRRGSAPVARARPDGRAPRAGTAGARAMAPRIRRPPRGDERPPEERHARFGEEGVPWRGAIRAGDMRVQ